MEIDNRAFDRVWEQEKATAAKNRAARLKTQKAKNFDRLFSHMNEDALAAMHRSAVESLTAQLLGIAQLKQNRETAEREQNNRAKLHNIGLFMGQLAAIAERQTRTPDWGEW